MLLRLITYLPIRWQYSVGRIIGKFIYYTASELRQISATNLALCFPEKSPQERKSLLKKNFAALGMGVIETAMAWWLSDKRLADCQINLTGLDYVEAAFKKGNGILLLGPHFMCLELVGRLLGARYAFAVLYRPHKKKWLAQIQENFRQKYRIEQIPKNNMRKLIRTLKNNTAVWYAYDIDAGEKKSVFAPFFGIQTASLTTASRLISMTDTTILPIRFYRREETWGYDIHIDKPLADFPTPSVLEDATKLNQTLEAAIRYKPEQYIWQYKRFKTRPFGEKRFY